MEGRQSAYAAAGVDYTKIQGFKDAMVAVGKTTAAFPNIRGVYIEQNVPHSHGGIYRYHGNKPHFWVLTQEGLGNKNWIAEWMAQFDGTGRTHYYNIAVDAVLMAVNDNIAQGAMPVVYADEVAAGDSDWFANRQRALDFAEGIFDICQLVGMALVAGESPALRFLVKAHPPVISAPSISGSVTGIIAPANRLITGAELRAGDRIIGVSSSGIHANGLSLVIDRAQQLPEKFLKKLPNGKTLGEEALIPTRSYVRLIEDLLRARVDIHALLPGTGDGVAKVAFDKRQFTYRIHSWPEKIPLLFEFMRDEFGLELEDCLKTFNWGIGYYIFAPESEVERIMNIGQYAGYEMYDLGVVEEGKRQTIFEPAGGLILPPPGE